MMSSRPWLAWSGAKKIFETFRIAELARARYAQIRHEKVPEDKIDYPDLMFGTVIKEVDPAVREAAIRAADDQARKELGDAYGLVEIGEIASVDQLMEGLEVQERLDAMMDQWLQAIAVLAGIQIDLERVTFSAKGASCRALESCVTGKLV